jgi:hypothetical protein
MGAALRAHLMGGALALLSVTTWLRMSLDLPHAPAGDGRLSELQTGLLSGSLAAEVAPALATLMSRDERYPLASRLSWMGAVVDSRLQDAVQVPAFPEEDGQALFALLLHPELERAAREACPEIPEALAVLCDPDAWLNFRTQTLKALGGVLSTKPNYAAAARVGGNDLALQAADHLCRMGEEGRAIALDLVKEAGDPETQALGILALGCAGNRMGVGPEIEALLGKPGAVGLAASLECALLDDCAMKAHISEEGTADAALRIYAQQLAGARE